MKWYTNHFLSYLMVKSRGEMGEYGDGGRGIFFLSGRKRKCFEEMGIADVRRDCRRKVGGNYKYLQLLCKEIIEFLLYRGFPRVKGTLGKVKILISRKSYCTQFYRLLE